MVDEKLEREIEKGRQKQLIRCVPHIFFYETLLYVGISKFRSMFIDEFREHKYKIDAIEVFQPNVEHWKANGTLHHIICGDIRTVEIKQDYDVVMWYHGPEHVERIHACEIFKKLEAFTKHILIVGCPWGDSPQGPEYGNENERHISSWNPDDLRNVGFDVNAIGRPNGKGSNILAWKYT